MKRILPCIFPAVILLHGGVRKDQITSGQSLEAVHEARLESARTPGALFTSSAPFRASIEGVMEEVDRVEMRILITRDGEKGSPIKLYYWTLRAQSPQGQVPVLIKTGATKQSVTLYTPADEPGGTHHIFDGTTTYYLEGAGLGQWAVTAQLWANKKGSTTGMYKLDEVAIKGNLSYKGAPFPSHKETTMTETFQKF
jgi:hypothetical protein